MTWHGHAPLECSGDGANPLVEPGLHTKNAPPFRKKIQPASLVV